MVKKINSSSTASKATSASAASEVLKTKSTSEVGSVRDVSGTKATSSAGRVRQPTRPMTSSERADLLRLVRDEADKLFSGGNYLPPGKKETLERAVKMALESSAVEDEGPVEK
jgi:hypothetical protein